MRVLVTGASGFLGSAVAREFSASGSAVVALVHTPVGAHPEFENTLCVDLREESEVVTAVADQYFDVVVDTAAVIPNKRANHHHDYFDNVLMTRNLLTALTGRPPGYLVKLSTLDVYAVSGEKSAINEHSAIEPATDYGFSKYISELWCRHWAKTRSVAHLVLRCTQLFGPGDQTGKFIPAAIRQMQLSGRITIEGDGTDERDYLFVDDAAILVTKCAAKRLAGVFNLASGESRSLNEVAAALKQLTIDDIVLTRVARKKNRHDYVFDMRNLRRALGPLNLTPFAEALRQTYAAGL